MFSSAARASLARLSRMMATVLLLLAVVSNPVLAAVGDTHEAARGLAGHLHELHDTAGEAGGAHADEDAGLSDLLHALVHAAHCCGHLAAVLPDLPLPLAPPGLGAAPQTEPMTAPSPRPASLIRPPILA